MIYIDASRYSNTEKRTGVENYSWFLIKELTKKYSEKITLISPGKIDLKVSQLTIPFPRLWTLIRLSWEVWRNKKINNLFVPSHVLPLIHPKNTTITIHDVVFKYSPKSYSWKSRAYLNWAAKFAVKHAKKIITPSEATKQDLIKFYKADPEKIHVIPLGFQKNTANKPPLPQEDVKTKTNKPPLPKGGMGGSAMENKKQKYFLSLGRIEYKKNTDTLIKAFQEFHKENKEVKLILAGFPGHGGKEILSNIPEELKDRIMLKGYVSEEEKQELLQNALCFIFPSRFEGFGIPLLEAMNANLPIIASNIPTSREIAEKNALFFEKEDFKALAKLMKKVVGSPELRKKMIQNHQKTLQKYSWEKCAEGVYEVISN